MRSFVSEYDLVVAKSLPEALQLLNGNESWRPLAGGTDLMVLFNAGRLPYRRLVGIADIPELRSIKSADDYVALGAAVTYTQIRKCRTLQAEFPLLCQAASWIGGVANQNRGTLGGNIANASPAADSAPALLVYDAELELASCEGSRLVRYADFHLAYKQVQLRPDELITQIRLPRRQERERVQYARKVGTRKAQAISKVCFAAMAAQAGNALCHVRIAVGSAAPTPLRCVGTEQVLEGAVLTPQVLRQAQERIAAEIQPITDIRSTDSYRRIVTVNLLGEFLESLL